MSQVLEAEMTTIPARRRALPAAPVLIQVPALARTAGAIRPRRRLRREVRVAGYWLLALVPASVACAAWGGVARPPVLLNVPSPDRVSAPAAADPAPERGITLSLDPTPALAGVEAEPCRVFLTGQILPLDAAEEPTHGGS